jgi:hypothetical protein
MAKVISTLFISADGVAEIDPGWHFPYFDENMGRAVGEDYYTADVLLLGRETYESFAGAWPDREAAGGEDAAFAKQLRHVGGRDDSGKGSSNLVLSVGGFPQHVHRAGQVARHVSDRGRRPRPVGGVGRAGTGSGLRLGPTLLPRRWHLRAGAGVRRLESAELPRTHPV